MSNERQQRIGILSRREMERRDRPDVLLKLTRMFGRELAEESFLPSDIAEELYPRLIECSRAAMTASLGQSHLQFPLTDSELFATEFQKRFDQFRAEHILLSLESLEGGHLLQVPVELVVEHFWSLLHLGGDGLAICSADMSKGLVADQYKDDVQIGFELACWGLR